MLLIVLTILNKENLSYVVFVQSFCSGNVQWKRLFIKLSVHNLYPLMTDVLNLAHIYCMCNLAHYVMNKYLGLRLVIIA